MSGESTKIILRSKIRQCLEEVEDKGLQPLQVRLHPLGLLDDLVKHQSLARQIENFDKCTLIRNHFCTYARNQGCTYAKVNQGCTPTYTGKRAFWHPLFELIILNGFFRGLI